MTGYLWAVLGLLAGLAITAGGDMASEEICDRLDHLPHAILHLAARRLDPRQRTTIYQDEWLPELTYILKGAETRPITRLITGTTYAVGILASTPRITRHLSREPAEAPSVSITVEGCQTLDLNTTNLVLERNLRSQKRHYIKPHRCRIGTRSIDVAGHKVARSMEIPHNI
jgi:hypothetical protein